MRALFWKQVFSRFVFYGGSYTFVFAFEHLTNLGTMPISIGIVDVTGKHCFTRLFSAFTPIFENIKWLIFYDLSFPRV